jgi:subtilase family serine protease
VVAGTAAQIESAFDTPIALFRHEGRVYHGPLADPAVPETLAATVHGVVGLDDLPKFRPLIEFGGGDSALAPADFAVAYDAAGLQAAGLTGAGRSIAVMAQSNFPDSDVATFSARFSHALAPRRIFTGKDPGILPDEGEQIEVLLDTQWAGALAPGASLNVVIGAKHSLAILDAIETAIDNRTRGLPSGDVISISFGLCEIRLEPVLTEFVDSLYAIANAQGQTVVVASGDSGARDCLPNRGDIAVNGLASSPHAVAVGGTRFNLDALGAVPPVVDETVWNDDAGASGGGRSIVFGMPRYQMAAGLGAFGPGRVLPDLALAASPRAPGYVIVQGGQTLVVGGTSAGVPALAGVLALVNERLAATHGIVGGLGQVAPELHRLGSEQARGIGGAVFRDVVAGSNGFPAGSGFDLATGWGAPLTGALTDRLLGPGRCEPLIDAVHAEAGCLVPSSPRAKGCAGEWLVEQDRFALRRRLPAVRQICRDGDSACDADGVADGHCTVPVALCVNVFDFRILERSGRRRGLPVCQSRRVRAVRLLSPPARDTDPIAVANRASLGMALAGLPLPTALVDACTTTVPVTIAAGGTLRLRARVAGALGTTTSRLTLACTP